MKINLFKKLMRNRGYIVNIGYGNGYTLLKGDSKYFISRYEIICLSDISYLNIEDYNFCKEVKL